MTRIEFSDREPDKYGRRHYTLYWTEPQGVHRPEASNHDGKPVGFRRGQCFHAAPPAGVVAWNGCGSPWAGMEGGEP